VVAASSRGTGPRSTLPSEFLTLSLARFSGRRSGEFVDFYNHRRYHKAIKDITPADMLAGRREEILGRRKEVKNKTIVRRKLSNTALRLWSI
jgi:hypothetical protein